MSIQLPFILTDSSYCLDDTKIKAQLLTELRNLSRFNPSRRPLLPRNQVVERIVGGENDMHVKDQVAEREALASLTDSVDKLLRKKKILLENLELFARDPQEDPKGERYLWLRDNFEKVDTCLNMMLHYVEMFYGTAYLPNQYVHLRICKEH